MLENENSEMDQSALDFFRDDNYYREVHFKAGEVHLKHFLFANRILDLIENVQQISKDLVREIVSIYKNQETKKDNSLTLIGYMDYIETLLFHTMIELNKIDGLFKKVEYHILSEHEEAEFKTDLACKTKEVILITPVGVTLQKEFEIRDKIQTRAKFGDGQEVHINNTVITIFLIQDKALINSRGRSENDPLMKRFGWLSLDEQRREINVKNIHDKNSCNICVKYLYHFQSEVYESSKCKLCIPEEITKELPLMIFNKKTRRPNIIFWKPQKENISRDKFIYSLVGADFDETCVINGHSEWDDMCFLHWVDHEEFYKRNARNIELWLKELRTKYNPNTINKSRIIIITPGRNHMSDFLYQLNHIFFDDSASVIHYNLSENLHENFVDFYKPLLKDICNTRFYYAEDVIDSESTFFELFNFLNGAQMKFSGLNRSVHFSGVFTMISRLSEYSETQIQSIQELEKFYGFFKLNIPPLASPQLRCPMCAKYEYYKKLSQSTVLDFLKYYYETKIEKIQRRRIVNLNVEQLKVPAPHRKMYYRFILERKILAIIDKSLHDSIDESIRNVEKESEKQKIKEVIETEIPTYRKIVQRKFDEKFLMVLVADQLYKILISEQDVLQQSDYQREDLYKPVISYVSFNDINCLKDEIRNFIFFGDAEKDPIQLRQKMTAIITLILFCKKIWIINNDLFKDNKLLQEIFEKKVEKTTIKILAFPPFVLYKDIKDFVFKYVLIELKDRVDRKYEDRYLFKKFLSLKFYQNRSVLLGSNFLLRDTTLNELKDIFDEGNKEVRVEKSLQKCNAAIDYIKEITSTVKSEFNTGELNKTEFLNVCSILLKNLRYRASRIKNYNYFLVSLIKERIHENVATSIILEKSLNMHSAAYDEFNGQQINYAEKLQKTDFFYLWRLLKLENIHPLRKFLKAEIGERQRKFWNSILIRLHNSNEPERFHLGKELQDWNNKFAFQSSYSHNIGLLNEYLGIFGSSRYNADLDSLFYTVLLANLLIGQKNEEEVQGKSKLENKLFVIMNLMCKILGLHADECTLSAFVDAKAYMDIDFKAEHIFSIIDKHVDFNSSIQQDGIIANMLTGISVTEEGYPQTFLELIQVGETFVGIRKEYYPAEKNSVNKGNAAIALDLNKCLQRDNAIAPFYNRNDHNYIGLFRFSKPSVPGTKMPRKQGNAVFVIAAKQNAPNFVHPNAIRLLLTVRPYIERFIYLYFQNDIFRSYNEVIKENRALSHFTHGLRENATAISCLIERITSQLNQERYNKEFRESIADLISIDVITKASFNQIYLSKLLSSEAQGEGDFQNRNITVGKFAHHYQHLFKAILRAPYGQGPVNCPVKVHFEGMKNQIFTFSEKVFTAIMVELFVNAKKYFWANEGYFVKDKRKECFIRFIRYQQTLKLEVGNNIARRSTENVKEGLSKIKSNGGLKLIESIYKVLLKQDFYYAFDESKREFVHSFMLQTWK